MDTINGTVGILSINSNYGFFIIDFDHNSEIEGKGISFMGFKSSANNGTDICLIDSQYDSYASSGFIMNTSNKNEGGWAASYMRSTIIPSFKKALSSNLVDVLKSVIIYSDNTGNTTETNLTTTTEEIYLSSEFEIIGE